jgi:hypothetical protein
MMTALLWRFRPVARPVIFTISDTLIDERREAGRKSDDA